MPEENIIIGNVALLRRDQRRSLHPRHGRRTFLRPQQRRQRGRGSRRRSRLRIHDRRPRGRARARPAAISPPACPAASPTSWTKPATFQRAATSRWSALEKLEDADEIEEVWKMIQRHADLHQQRSAPRRSSRTGSRWCRSSSKSCPRITSACSQAIEDASRSRA